MDRLDHKISLEGLEAIPKDLGSLVIIQFPNTLPSIQSFLGSLNYYSRCIEDFANLCICAVRMSISRFSWNLPLKRGRSGPSGWIWQQVPSPRKNTWLQYRLLVWGRSEFALKFKGQFRFMPRLIERSRFTPHLRGIQILKAVPVGK